MNEYTISKLRQFFYLYYSNIKDPDFFKIRKIEKRELAFSFFDRTGMTRHTSFSDTGNLYKFINENIPQHFYYSSAYYRNPSADMDAKMWEGSDLIFDIDGDHIVGAELMKYSEMLNAVKLELIKLINLLRDDFSLKWNNMEVVFSGSRGYHLHVYDIFNDIESQERREIVDYITGKCTSEEYKLNPKNKWNSRIENEFRILMSIVNSDKQWREKIQKETGLDLKGLKKNDKKLIDILEREARKIAKIKYSSLIDEPVTIDIHRLIRTPNSLHGKSGLRVLIVDPEKIEKFDPLNEAVPKEFENLITEVKIIKKFKSEIGKEPFDLNEGNYTLPLPVAIFSVLKGNGEFLQTT